MKQENLKGLLKLLNDSLNTSDYKEDNSKIKFVIEGLSSLDCYAAKELEDLKDIIVDLEIKYDSFSDLSYYFDPVYVQIKKNIHNKEVALLREKNRKKKEYKK